MIDCQCLKRFRILEEQQEEQPLKRCDEVH